MSDYIFALLVLSLVYNQNTPKELVKLRLLIETGAADLVIDNATDEELEQLKKASSYPSRVPGLMQTPILRR